MVVGGGVALVEKVEGFFASTYCSLPINLFFFFPLLIFLKKGTEWVRQLPLMDTDKVTQVIKNRKSRQA